MKNKNNHIIGCYFQEVTVNMGSYILEKIGDFSIFVLEAIKDGFTIQEIIISSGFSKYVIDKTVETLCSENLLVSNNNSYTISPVGDKYITINNIIKAFNQSSDRFAINCYTCQMEKIKDETLFYNKCSYDRQLDILPSYIDKIMLKSPNYENVREYMRDAKLFSSLSDTDYNHIYFIIQPTNNRFIVPYIIDIDTYSYNEIEDDDFAKIILKIPIAKITVNKYSERDEEYKDILNELDLIAKRDLELLSEKGKGIIEREKRLREINSSKQHQYYDAFNCSALYFDIDDNNWNDDCIESSKWHKISLPQKLSKSQKRTSKDGIISIYSFEYKFIDRIIGFDRLKQVDENDE